MVLELLGQLPLILPAPTRPRPHALLQASLQVCEALRPRGHGAPTLVLFSFLPAGSRGWNRAANVVLVLNRGRWRCHGGCAQVRCVAFHGHHVLHGAAEAPEAEAIGGAAARGGRAEEVDGCRLLPSPEELGFQAPPRRRPAARRRLRGVRRRGAARLAALRGGRGEGAAGGEAGVVVVALGAEGAVHEDLADDLVHHSEAHQPENETLLLDQRRDVA
mmetsp:Transcript_39168/g.103379  ORF Transcript_39168/g.103379 Transcript_39168/m.103379 type:complete len:218 (-) Transcript_39168:109-762(-)